VGVPKYWMLWGGVAVLCLGLSGAASPARAEKMTDVTFTSLADGMQYRLADYRNYQIIMLFGSIYCRPCVGLLPVMNRFYEETRDLKVLVVGVDVDTLSEEPRIRQFVLDQAIKFPFFIDSYNLSKQHKIFMLPSVLFIDGGGDIAKKIIGPKPLRVFEQELERVKQQAERHTPACPASAEGNAG
jgi:thiol-disulfide isomerase/thioredoxin